MNNVFNIQRFARVMGKDFHENWKSYLLQILALFGVMAAILIYQSISYYPDVFDSKYESMFDEKLLTSACFMFLIYIAIQAATLMFPMQSKTGRISYLSLPASHLEKFLSRWLIVTVGSVVIFFAALWLADLLRVAIFSFRYPEGNVHMIDFSRLIYPGEDYSSRHHVFPHIQVFFICLSLAYLFQSLCVLGATFWTKNSIIKTIAAIIVVIGLYVLVCRWAILGFYDSFDEFGNVLGSLVNKSEISEQRAFSGSIIVLSFFVVLNWVLAFFRFRESEIIKRL
ncbi:hypothetical protein LJB84_03190 [Bacteroidales bacterium OttesenSCG-928-J19]|nr:hypothetical protein [Bacteroidales bacterium OttesenSCG-928-J19]